MHAMLGLVGVVKGARWVSAACRVPAWTPAWFSGQLPSAATMSDPEGLGLESSVDPSPEVVLRTVPARRRRRLRKRRAAIRAGTARRTLQDRAHLAQVQHQVLEVKNEVALLQDIVLALGSADKTKRWVLQSTLEDLSEIREDSERTQEWVSAKLEGLQGLIFQLHDATHQRMSRSEVCVAHMYQLGCTEVASIKREVKGLEKGDFFQHF